MAKSYLDSDGLLYLWGKIKNYVTGKVPVPYTSNPAMNGTASSGSSTNYAKGDHVHPSDTSKVDVVSGKGLSTNDFTTALKDKLDGIASGAEVNVQSDWSETNSSSDAFIKNKPDVASKNIWFADCITAESTTAKVATTTSGDFSLVAGNMVRVRMKEAYGATTNTTLIVDNCEAKSIVAAHGDAYTAKANLWGAGDVVDFVYDGSKFLLSYGVSATVNNYGITKLSNSVSSISSEVAATSNAVKTAYDLAAAAVPSTAKGSANGVCPLNASSKIDSSYLPSYVDDVIEAYPVSGATELSAGWLSVTSGGTALTPESGKIYVLMAASTNYDANMQFRWSGTTYVALSSGGVSAITNAEIDTIVAS